MSNSYADGIDDATGSRPDRPSPGQQIVLVRQLKSFIGENKAPVLVLESEVVTNITTEEQREIKNKNGSPVRIPGSAKPEEVSGHAVTRHGQYPSYYNNFAKNVVSAIRQSMDKDDLAAFGLNADSKTSECLEAFTKEGTLLPMSGVCIVQKVTTKDSKIAKGDGHEVWTDIKYDPIAPDKQPSKDDTPF